MSLSEKKNYSWHNSEIVENFEELMGSLRNTGYSHIIRENPAQ